ncbi:MAG: glycosyltransferase [bacterium]
MLQLPIYNERHVIKRLLKSTARIDYPRDKLHIQVLDDSTDATVKLAQRLIGVLQKRGFRLEHLRRETREGFKAGALAYGLQYSTAPYIAIFDADFVIPPDFLKRTLPFLLQPDIGLVQTRWGHLNRNANLLTRLQAMIMDAHFRVEHFARNRSDKFFIFNGTAGIWKRQAILDAGGWQHDTLAEDTDISFRAQLRGWRFMYLHEVVAPAELPEKMRAYKTQQHRWVKGTVQAAMKLTPIVWKSPLPFKKRLATILHLFSNLAFALMVIPAVLALPWVAKQIYALHLPLELALAYFFIIAFAMSAVVAYYGVTLKASTGKLWPDILLAPFMAGLGIFLSFTHVRAALEALRGYQSEFVRTPKSRSQIQSMEK